MKRLKLVGVMLGALFALALMATNAFALPDLSVTLSGGTYPVKTGGSLAKSATSLGSASGVTLSGEGVTLLLSVAELSALGTFTTDFTNVQNSAGVKCHSSGDASGVVLVGGDVHLVYTNLSPLTLGILFLVSEFEVECPGGTSTLVRGNVIGSIGGIGSEATELTGFSGTLVGANGKQEISEYYNSTGTKIKAKLEGESGSGFVASDENVEGVVGLSVLGSQMVVITGR
jgi:hypothetical protein